MVTIAKPTGERVLLRAVSWEAHERLLTDQGDRGSPRLTYDRGELEFLAPSTGHERDNRDLALLVELVASELSRDILDVGSMTFKRESVRRGFEPDTAFYTDHYDQVAGKDQIDPEVDPPPDLVIEIDVTRPIVPTLPIHAAFGVPEVWRSDGDRVAILRLGDGDYRQVAASVALPPVTSEVLTHFLVERRRLRRVAWMRAIRHWARDVAYAR